MTELELHMTELRSCVKVEVAVLGSPSLIVLTVSVDVKQHWTNSTRFRSQRNLAGYVIKKHVSARKRS